MGTGGGPIALETGNLAVARFSVREELRITYFPGGRESLLEVDVGGSEIALIHIEIRDERAQLGAASLLPDLIENSHRFVVELSGGRRITGRSGEISEIGEAGGDAVLVAYLAKDGQGLLDRGAGFSRLSLR